MSFRKVVFWVHLVAGLVSGISVGIMCFTGTVLAYEKEIAAWSERDARRVEAPAAGTPRLSLDEVQRKLREAQPELRPATMVVYNDPEAAIAFPAGRAAGVYVNPYTGEVRQPQSSSVGAFMQTMVEWHRYLGFSGEQSRPRGKLINGICNLAFCALAITGLYIWMPRTWSWRALRPAIWFTQNSSSKARDWNWHNSIGFWTAPILIVLTLTAVPISFQWGGRAINALTGTPASAAPTGGPGAAAAVPAVDVPAPAPGTPLLGQDALLAAAQKAMPDWQTITIRTGNAPVAGRGGAGGGRGGRGGEGRGGAEGRAGGAPANAPATALTAPMAGGGGAAAVQAATFTVRESNSWPRTANTTLSLNPYTGEVLRRTGYAEMAAAQQVRAWTRFLHTGEALGKVGQFFAGLACLGGCFLVYTGFALSWRRFFGKKRSKSGGAAIAEPTTAGATTARS